MSLSFLKEKKEGVDLALIMCPAWSVSQAPVAISYLKSFLEKHNMNVKCFDLNMEFYKVFPEKKYWDLNYPDHFITSHVFERDIAPSLNPFIHIWAESILGCNPKVVGFSLFMSTIRTSLLLAKYLKKLKPDLVIIGGGAEVTRVKKIVISGEIYGFAHVDKDIFNFFDVLIEGEGEITLLEVLSLFNKGRDFHHVNGVLYRSEERVVVNRPRELIADLDILSPPDYSEFDLKNYTRSALPIVTSRGCVNRCTFCADSPIGKIYRQRSAKKIIEEMKYLLKKYESSLFEIVDSKKYKSNLFEIVDSIFNGDINRIDRFCDLIIKSKLDVSWSAKVTLRKGMSRALLQKMKEAGCNALSYGVESASPRVLKHMRKNIDIGEAKKIIRNTHEAGIQANCFFMIGYPVETERDFQMTLDFIKENAEFIYRFDQVTGCHIEEDSYLGLNLEKLGIIFKGGGAWYSKESSPEIRRERLERFRKLARELHKNYKCDVQL